MSKNVIMQESGTSKSLSSIDKIVTPVQGGNAIWYPEDETQVGEITVTSNGEYVPNNDGLYAYYKVNVNVPNGNKFEIEENGIESIVVSQPATEPTSSVIGVDPATGELVRYELSDVGGVPTISKTTVESKPKEYKPVGIKVLIPPAKTAYYGGDKINYTGLTVMLLDKDGYCFTDSNFPDGILAYGAPYFYNGDTSKSYGIITEVDKVPDVGGSPNEDTEIPVKWLSPYDNTTYSDSFDIRILEKQSAASDDGFSGSGGG